MADVATPITCIAVVASCGHPYCLHGPIADPLYLLRIYRAQRRILTVLLLTSLAALALVIEMVAIPINTLYIVPALPNYTEDRTLQI